MKNPNLIFFVFSILYLIQCSDENEPRVVDPPDNGTFYFGADLSFANQILDHGGIYKDNSNVESPYKIFKDHGANLVRFRLWHNPVWTQEVYAQDGLQLYNDLKDVEEALTLAKQNDLETMLDFHYSDTWADPGNQKIPAAWLDIKEISVLKDSVYNYTLKTLKFLDEKGLMPRFVQIGNEINCGMLYTDAPVGFPSCYGCNGQWKNLGDVINSAIKAVRDASEASSVKPKVILHVADPTNVEWWFDNIKSNGQVSDFEIIGFSYYPLWHTTVAIDDLSDNVSAFRTKYGKEVMLMETAYPWTTQTNDNYNNLLGGQNAVAGYPYTQQGQLDIMKMMTQEMKDGEGYGIIYWEPDWISSEMKDLWGTGSAWENSTFFDFDGNTIQGIDFMTHEYK